MKLKDSNNGARKSKLEVKNCKVCLLPFENRKRWSSRDLWEKVQYCSMRCRRMKNNSEYKEKFKNT